MRVLPNIDIKTDQSNYMWFEQNTFNRGIESNLYVIPSIFGEGTVAKIWKIRTQSIIQNKFEKIKRLYQIDMLKEINDIKILASISCNGKIIGYLMNQSNFRQINQVPQTRIETLKYLILARQKLQQFLDLGILYGDITSDNILVFKNNVCFCDLDNVAYQGFEMDIRRMYLDLFLNNYGKMDEKAVSYMYNCFTMKNLCHLDTNVELEEYLQSNQIPRELLLGPYRYIKEQMQIITPAYEGLYFIDYIKDKYKQKINSLIA